MTTNPALRRSGRRELDQPFVPVRLEQRLCSASHDTKVRLAPGLHFCCSGVRFDREIYDGHIVDEKFSAELAGAERVNGSPVKPVEVGLGSAGGDILRARQRTTLNAGVRRRGGANA